MKDHIIIPLLVVCVGLPLVTLGMYYLCESLPIAEDMRKREAQGIAERRQARGNDDSTTYEEKDTTNRAPQPNVMASNGGVKVEIMGVSINLPYNEMKQKFAEMFKTESYRTKAPLDASNIGSYLGSYFHSPDTLLFDHSNSERVKASDLPANLREEMVGVYGSSVGAHTYKVDQEFTKELYNFWKNVLNWPINRDLDDFHAWWGDGTYGSNILIFSWGKGDCGCCVDFAHQGGRAKDYYDAVCKKYGTPEMIFDHIKRTGDSFLSGDDKGVGIEVIAGEDGLIVIESDDGYPKKYCYFNQSILNRYKSYIPQKRERDKKRVQQLREAREQLIKKIEQEVERRKKRDSGI